MTNPNDSVSPIRFLDHHNEPVLEIGLTKREYFAAMALQGLLARDIEAPMLTANGVKKYYEEVAVIFADALIAALNRDPK